MKISLSRTRGILAAAIVLGGIGIGIAHCSRREPPIIRVRDTDIVIQNRTNTTWSNVQLFVNDYYGGAVPSLQPTQQLFVPLDTLQTAFGQRFDRKRQRVYGVLIKARAADGTDVRHEWGKVWKGR